jgi:DNA primase
MAISEETINEIKERAGIVAVVSEYVDLKSAGQNFKGLCPFHSEKTPSFTVSPSKGIFHCFGCGVGGNVFHFLMKFKGISFPDAVKLLGEKVGVPVESAYPGDERARNRTETLYRINSAASAFFEKYLYSEGGVHALNYLLARRLSASILREFHIGYSPGVWDALLSHLYPRGFSVEDIEETGLIVKRKSGQGHYDRFRNRVMFPIFDNIGRCIGFGGRTLEADKPEIPKYINSNENLLYHKGRFLFGFTNAQEAIRKEDGVIIVEGYVDVLRMHQEGLKNTIAPLGTALTEDQVSLISRYTKNVYLAFDSDEAGAKAAVRSATLMQKKGIDPSVVRLPAGRDPGDFFDEYSVQDFKLLLADAVPGIPYVVSAFTGTKKKYTANEKIVILTQLTDYYNTISDDILKLSLLDTLSGTLEIQKAVLEREFAKLAQKRRDYGPPPAAERKRSDVSHELRLLLLILGNPTLTSLVKGRLDETYFRGKWTKHLWDSIIRAEEHGNWDSATVFDYIDHERFVQYLSGRLMDETLHNNPKEQVIDIVAGLKERRLRERLGRINQKLRKAELENDDSEVSRLIVEKQACTNEVEKVRLLRAQKSRL